MQVTLACPNCSHEFSIELPRTLSDATPNTSLPILFHVPSSSVLIRQVGVGPTAVFEISRDHGVFFDQTNRLHVQALLQYPCP
jgi:hypothetical protein